MSKLATIDCVGCPRKYKLVIYGDLTWIRNSLDGGVKEGATMIDFSGTKILKNKLLEEITGCALREDGTMDVCFKMGEKRGCLNCVKQNGKFKGVNVREIYFE